ncbi:hypothetical protein ABNN70_05765 [Sporolactobacillus sp. Y61]|uniref:Glycosyl hydrolase n=1 Tax=Sporolactobacillus sp. Y61 TaxID=3160863 RepID=A0AAU8IHR6_9BACL
MQKIFVTIILSVTVLLSGCSPSHQPTERGSDTHEKPVKAPPAAVVENPWKEGMFQKGVQIYLHADKAGDAFIRERIRQNLDYVVKLGANSVGVSFPIYTDGATPTRVYVGPATPGRGLLKNAILEAKKRQLRVLLRPILDESNIVSEEPLAWRGSIRPENNARWFQSYGALLSTYAALAAQLEVEEFVAGTELVSLQSQKSEWRTLKTRIRAAGFDGKLSYAANWDSYADLSFEPGIDAYPKIHLSDRATVPQLTQALYQWLTQLPVTARGRLTIQEAGIAAQSGMYPKPYVWNSKAPVNETVQARWFQAMYQAAKKAQVNGLYYWALDVYQDPEQELINGTRPFSFVRKNTEAVIRSNFAD